MADYMILLPSQPKVISEEGEGGVFEIEGLYPGYGHTLGNSLRRIILSSLPGVAITSVKIAGVNHEFTVLEGVKEDVVTILLNLKKIRMRFTTDEPQTLYLKIKGLSAQAGEKVVRASDLEVPGQVTIITLDGIFTPIRRASYEVENMRVGDRTDFNKLKMFIETDGTISPSAALSSAIGIMINQLKAIVGFREDEPVAEEKEIRENRDSVAKPTVDPEVLKTRMESLDISSRTRSALSLANIRTVGGLARKKEKDLLEIDGLGVKGIQEIKKALGEFGITLK